MAEFERSKDGVAPKAPQITIRSDFLSNEGVEEREREKFRRKGNTDDRAQERQDGRDRGK